MGSVEPTSLPVNIMPVLRNELLTKGKQERLSMREVQENVRFVVFMSNNSKCQSARLSLLLGFSFMRDLCYNTLKFTGTLSFNIAYQ